MGVERNPRDSMKSTWRQDKSQWKHHHYLLEWLGITSTDLNREIPVHAKTDKMSYIPQLDGHIWVLTHALWPVAAHQLYVSYTGNNLPWWGAMIFYATAFKINAIHQLHMMKDLGHRYGYLDGDKHARDEIPDHSVSRVLHALSSTATMRPVLCVFLAYSKSQVPSTLSPWVVLEIGLYGIILDFWFYWYHRCMHEFDSLWRFHRTHHLTKHPNPLLTLYADFEQEIFDIAIIPLMTYFTIKAMGLPMGFYDWWLCHQYIVFTELFGHSGLRLYITPPSTNFWFLRMLNAELATEDHDLHHRQGWKKSMNYGKQTLLWDRLFGTAGKRIESTDANIDFSSPANLNLLVW